MGVKEAIQDLINSEGFKNKAKQRNAEGAKYRMFIMRFNKGELKTGATIDFLIEHDYRIEIKKPKKGGN